MSETNPTPRSSRSGKTSGTNASDPPRRPTLEEVARLAGVSRSVASRAMNDVKHVNPLKREAVRHAAEELGYVPNPQARALATKSTGSVVLAISDEDPAYFGDPFFSQILVGIATSLERSELDLTLVMASSTKGRARLEHILTTHRADGVMLLGVPTDDPLCTIAEGSTVPVVFCGRPVHDAPRFYVDADNRGGARRATEHLIAQGRHRIATITGPLTLEASAARHGGFTDAMAVAGRSADLVAAGDFTREGGAAAMEILLTKDPGIDAVFAASDGMAAGALRTLRAHGRSVPHDVAVVGFDDLVIAQETEPPLTTVRQPVRALGQEMAAMLLRIISGDTPSPIILPTDLVIRESTEATRH